MTNFCAETRAERERREEMIHQIKKQFFFVLVFSRARFIALLVYLECLPCLQKSVDLGGPCRREIEREGKKLLLN